MNIGDKKELTTEELKTLTQEQFEAYVQKEDSQTLNEMLELRGNLPIFDKDDEEKDKKVCADLVEKCQKYMAEEDQDIDAFKEVFKTAQSLLKNSTTLSDKQRIELHIIKGNIQDNVRENFDGAINEYKKALKIDSGDWTIWYNLGVSYGRKGEADLAISIYKKVIKLNPESGASYYNRAGQYLIKNEFDKACEDFHCAQSLGIDSSIPIKKYCIPKEQDDIGKYIEQHTIEPEEINPEDFIR